MIYKGFHEVTMAELRIHLENDACLGESDEIEAMFDKMEVGWETDHLLIAIDKLEEGTTGWEDYLGL